MISPRDMIPKAPRPEKEEEGVVVEVEEAAVVDNRRVHAANSSNDSPPVSLFNKIRLRRVATSDGKEI